MSHDLNISHRQHLLAQSAIIRLVENDPLDATLDDHLGAELARVRCRVDGSTHGAISSGFHDRGLLSVETQAFIQVDTLLHIVIASLASALVTVGQAERSPIVTCRYDPVVHGDDGPIAFLHAVGSAGS